MLTQAYMEKAFKAYLKEIDLCLDKRCYWALLHLAVVLPDICGALESKDGEATDGRYKGWCKRYLADPLISPDERYQIRCKVLHQGRTLAEEGRYKNFKFQRTDAMLHRRIVDQDSLILDVGEMAKEIRKGMYDWFLDLERNNRLGPGVVANVERNLTTLACIQEESISKFFPGADITVMVVNTTTSSPYHP